ncbi:MAG: ABC transporter ATP-binding protein [Inconstantimicrobium porci]|uniref:ABC transporter ATP-binding protein n=1 Tax=Inconstantimicrobium porci TaxID=2652291 RepID=UPI00240A8266|nr:ABC transporter ATP-binding protein [Inconstantimicrobium porci]MDD6771251.1 ABC transporter ATP-binding protein [Inconstantimicrobium porci]MDY5911322.1 ABC transporter ATP-binding protein [Inconstantimicrobium porci]
MAILETKNLKKYYGEGETLVKALDDVSISINKGEFVAIIGASGSGKSTLLHLLGGLDNQTEGQIIVNGQDITKLKRDELAVFRRRNIGFVFQSYNLVPVLNVCENIGLPIGFDNGKIDKEFLDELLTLLKLDNKKHSVPAALSGGQQQRVAIARALISKPSIILADEPTGNLDSKTSQEVMNIFKLCVKKYNQTLVLITHDERIAQMADRVIKIQDGRVSEV